MAELIMVDREDGPVVAGLMTSLLENWERIPISVQAAIIKHAIETGFESVGRNDGNYAVTAFILKHRSVMMRDARWQPRMRVAPGGLKGGLATRAREAAEAIAAGRGVSLKAASRLIRIDLGSLMPRKRGPRRLRIFAALTPRRSARRQPA